MYTDMSREKSSIMIKIYCFDKENFDKRWTLVYEGPLRSNIEVTTPINKTSDRPILDNRICLHLEIIDADMNYPSANYFCDVKDLNKDKI
jgi:hypothetical protein